MSALGHKRTFGPLVAMSTLPPKSGHSGGRASHVRFVPSDAATAARLLGLSAGHHRNESKACRLNEHDADSRFPRGNEPLPESHPYMGRP
jgi:hypothetical protein